MPNRLQGKVAVVTGASKGLGAEIACQLAAEGAAVVVNYSSSRIGQPDDIAPAVVFFASDDSKWITGETLFITGGFR